MDAGYTRTRRNLIIYSSMLFVMEIKAVSLKTANFIWNGFNIEKPDLLMNMAWAVYCYLMFRYLQYFFSETKLDKIREYINTGKDEIIVRAAETNLRKNNNLLSFSVPLTTKKTISKAYTTINGKKIPAHEIVFLANVIYKNEPKKITPEKITDYICDHEIMLEIFWLNFRGYLGSIKLAEYCAPLIIMALPLFAKYSDFL